MSNFDNGLRGHCDACHQQIDGIGDREGVIIDGLILCADCAAERAEAEIRAGQLDDEIDRRRSERKRH